MKRFSLNYSKKQLSCDWTKSAKAALSFSHSLHSDWTNTIYPDIVQSSRPFWLNKCRFSSNRSVIYAILTEQIRQNTLSFSQTHDFDWTNNAFPPIVQSFTSFWLNRSGKTPFRSVTDSHGHPKRGVAAKKSSKTEQQLLKTKKDTTHSSRTFFLKPATLALRARSFVRTVPLHSALYAVPFSTLAALTKKTDRFAVCLLRKPATSYFSRRSPTKYHRRKGA